MTGTRARVLSLATHSPHYATSSNTTLPCPARALSYNAYSMRARLPQSCYHRHRRRNQSTAAAALSAATETATNLFNDAALRRPAQLGPDPLRSISHELKFLAGDLKKLVGSGHPILDTVAKYYAQADGKHVRPMLVLLMSQATALTPQISPIESDQNKIDIPITDPSVLADHNPSKSALGSLYAQDHVSDPTVLPAQRRLAEITELIHTASLLHDDVIDHSESRRSQPSANMVFGNKMAVLAGDFLLGRASVALARLRDPEVTELLATVIANLVEGEFMQLRNTALDERNPVWTDETISYYLYKTYLKSASLISKSCRAAALLGRRSPQVVDAAYAYGKNLGLAFQLVDDMLDYTVNGVELGKPAGADLELGLATAPLLFAWKQNPELGTLVGRKFSEKGDVSRARSIVMDSDGIAQTRALAQSYADSAASSISMFPESEAKQGLMDMCTKVMTRRK